MRVPSLSSSFSCLLRSVSFPSYICILWPINHFLETKAENAWRTRLRLCYPSSTRGCHTWHQSIRFLSNSSAELTPLYKWDVVESINYVGTTFPPPSRSWRFSIFPFTACCNAGIRCMSECAITAMTLWPFLMTAKSPLSGTLRNHLTVKYLTYWYWTMM